MPPTQVYLYRDDEGRVPVLDWLLELASRDRRAADVCYAMLRRLRALGYELRRPHADMLRDGIYELRVRRGRVNYRLLYFFHGRNITVIAHALTKEDKVADADINRAVERRRTYEQDPPKYQAALNF